MTKIKKPKAYNAPLRSRKAIIAFLADHHDYYRFRGTCSPIAWNVKDHGSDLEFDNLVEVYKKGHNYGQDEVWLDSPEYLKAAREKYDEVKDKLWEWAIERARESVMEDDAYKCLWDGTELQVTYEFGGRSGGWLLMTKFEGEDLSSIPQEHVAHDLGGMPYKTLVKLYKLVVQNDHDFRSEAVTSIIEENAAFDLFENVCADVPRPDTLQMELPLTKDMS
jgi:hypothetical protein